MQYKIVKLKNQDLDFRKKDSVCSFPEEKMVEQIKCSYFIFGEQNSPYNGTGAHRSYKCHLIKATL